ncbi:hypothetical protein QWY28_13730 [Nocardioides sp. SOB77]|uniref:Uncharacterized protein n=1 Tax=Nocardioides oceani TaxID=3058369 RepID=A0ABT8FH46_9ACTN|nr:hypothetical protein [Nocardioides oceani]MDN4174016.1 hypothetical protein [Nocardioides oceani]
MSFRTAAAIAAASVAFTGTVATGVSAAAPATSATSTTTTSTTTSSSTEPAMTRLTYDVAGCEGCEVQLVNGRMPEGADQPVVWSSKVKRVEDGRVRFTVATRRTWGMSTTLRAPWEGHTGYVTTVVQRYRGMAVGDRVSFRQARHRGVASSCWAGTRGTEVRTAVVVRKVQVDGVRERVPGTLAFTRTTQDWHDPMRRAPGGVLGSQDVDVCR